MNKTEFTRQLRATADELKPLAESAIRGASIWNGTNYVKTNEEKKPDPYALGWLSTLVAIADLIDAQETELSEKQVGCLEHLLFGGIGSLTDLSFDSSSLGEVAETINDALNRQTRVLYSILRGGPTGVRY